MFTIRYRTLMAFFVGVALTLITAVAFQAWRANAAPGDSDTTFVPITPCRLIDTRPNVPGETPTNVGPRNTPIPQNDPVTFTAWGSGDLNSLCEIPTSATAISTNTTIVNPANDSFLKLYPADAALPGTSNLNYVAGQAATPNAVTTPLSPTGQFKVFNRFGTVDVIVDINGYYTKTSLQQLQSQIDALRAAQPFAVTKRDASETVPRGKDVVVVSVQVSAPVSGHVTVIYTTTVKDSDLGEILECSITTGKSIDFDYVQEWGSPWISTLSGNRRFAIAAKNNITYNLVCSLDGSSAHSLFEDSVLTAIFTPAP